MRSNKYPQVIIDTDENIANSLHPKIVTVEEWNDYVLHHTHEGLGSSNSGGSTDGSTSTEVMDAINTLTALVQQIQGDITDIKAYIDQDIQIDNSSSDNNWKEIEDQGDDIIDDDLDRPIDDDF